jgi:hypothetical protein
MICTIYSHHLGFEKILEIVQKNYPKWKLTVSNQGESKIAELEIKGGLFSFSKKIKISYRQRITPSYKIPKFDDSPLTANLKGLYGFVSSLPTTNETVKNLFLQKIQTLNCEFSISQEQGETLELKSLIENLASEFEAILFVQPNTIISKADGQHFLDNNLQLIIDGQGNCEIDKLDVQINSIYFDGEQLNLTEDQVIRKSNNEKILVDKKIKVNKNLPCIVSENEVVIRPVKEIAQRIVVLAVTNLVAFNDISSEQATDYLKKYNLWHFVTPKEKEFLANPTDEKKNIETWKCEGIWVLMWVLNKVENLGFPDEFCNLDNISAENYPVGENKDPNIFINSILSIRSKSEILDANDLHYRIEWACVDARINSRQLDEVNTGVVYERHYALNWLINYMGQNWDDISCDT